VSYTKKKTKKKRKNKNKNKNKLRRIRTTTAAARSIEFIVKIYEKRQFYTYLDMG